MYPTPDFPGVLADHQERLETAEQQRLVRTLRLRERTGDRPRARWAPWRRPQRLAVAPRPPAVAGG